MKELVILTSEEINKHIDNSCSADSNLQHILHMFEGYRAFTLENNGLEVETQPYHPDGARDISFQCGWRLAKKDSELMAKTIPQMFNFREYRQNAGMTLREVDLATGISNAYLSQLETGKIKKPSFESVKSLIKKVKQFLKSYLSLTVLVL